MAAGSVNQEPFSRFADFVAATKRDHIGQDLAGNQKNYIPPSALREYWTVKCISRVLRAFPDHLDVDVDIIRRKYLRVFSILVYTSPDAVRNLQRLFVSHGLSDETLPWRKRPGVWCDEPFYRDFFKSISPNQWQFLPLDFARDNLHDHLIDDEHILPIDPPSVIAQGSAAAVKRIEIHSEFNHLAPRGNDGQPTESSFVFKTYHNKKQEDWYENELRALKRLSVDPSPNIVKFYGSFRQYGSYCLVLEFVNGGDLGEFFKREDHPSTADEAVLFWTSLFRVFNGLDRIHLLIAYNEDELIKGIHEDIRPENILLERGTSGSPYDFTPKIADFGLYSKVRTGKTRSSGSMGMDHHGNQRFSSPECCHHTVQRHKGTNMITTLADIFSAGAVISHTAAWVVGGHGLQVAYFQSRKKHHEKELPRFKHSGYEGCFHDSIKPLPVIAKEHRGFVAQCHPGDDVTPAILDWVEKHMLVELPKSRSRARDILERFEQLIERRESSAPLPDPEPAPSSAELPTGTPETPEQSPFWSENLPSASTVDGVSPESGLPIAPTSLASARPALRVTISSSIQDMAANPQLPVDGSRLTTEAGLSSVNQPSSDRCSRSSSSRNQRPDDSRGTSTSRSPISSIAHHVGIHEIQKFKLDISRGQPVDQDTALLVEYLEHNLQGRDQFFFIDDSSSMMQEHKTIQEGFSALACIAKRLDPNKVELAFASQPRKVFKAKRMKRLRDLVAECKYKGEAGMMEDRIGDLIQEVIIPRLPRKILGVNINLRARKKVSVYVFTDGDWGHASSSGNACGVERPVRSLIEVLRKRGLTRTQVSLHFVRFGDKENGRLHLQRLDDFGKTPGGLDIVDVKHIRGGVMGMILGPLTEENDDSPGG